MGMVSLINSDRSETTLRTLRQSAGLSRSQLAARAGIALSTLYLLEDGLGDTRVSTLMKLAHALGVTPDSLLGLRKAA